MMPIVTAFITAHAPGLTGYPQAAEEKSRETVFAAFDVLREAFVRAQPDIIVGISNDHFSNFFDPMPAFCLGLGEKFEGPDRDFAPIMGLDCQTYMGHPDYAGAIMEQAFDDEFDIAVSRADLKFEDQFPIPLHFISPARDVPIVPLFINCLSKPMPSLKRCYALGQTLAKVAAKRPERIALLATGGLSHWVGVPEEGQINAEFEEMVLSQLKAGHPEKLFSLTDAEIEAAGNGAHEIRNWLTAVGAVNGQPLKVMAHVPIPQWQTGIVIGTLPAAA